jgi:hypothetical protein
MATELDPIDIEALKAVTRDMRAQVAVIDKKILAATAAQDALKQAVDALDLLRSQFVLLVKPYLK